MDSTNSFKYTDCPLFRNRDRLVVATVIVLILLSASSSAEGSNDAGFPEWAMEHRIHFHWESSAPREDSVEAVNNWYETRKERHLAIANAGAKFAVVIGRHGAEGAWWASEVGESFPAFRSRDVLGEVILDDLGEKGVGAIIYNRHDMDYAMQDKHPEWLARNADGSPLAKTRADERFGKVPYQMCMNSPFREFTKKRLVEIFNRGAKGVYFDQDHMPEVCYCDNCKLAFARINGKTMPVEAEPGTVEYLEMTRFIGNTLAETFKEWKEAVTKVNPETVFYVGAQHYGQFVDLHMTEQAVSSWDASKMEFQKAFGGQQHGRKHPLRLMKEAHPDYWFPPRDLQESLSWVVVRDVNKGHPPHVWVHKPDPEVKGEVIHTAAAVVAHGGIAGMAIPATNNYPDTYRNLFEMSSSLSQIMKDARPYAWAMIHISNELKEKYYLEGGSSLEERYRIRFEKIYAPVLGAAATLNENHLPYATLPDGQLMEQDFPPETRVLILPQYDELPDHLKKAVEAIRKKGKISIITLKKGWHLEQSQLPMREELSDILFQQPDQPEIRLIGPNNLLSTYMVNEKTGRILISLVRDWHWFWFHSHDRGQLWIDEYPKQAPIRDITIKGKNLNGMREIWPDTRKLKIDREAYTIPQIDIVRFVEVKLRP